MSTVEIPTSIWSRLGQQLPSAAAISGLLLMIALLLKNFVEWTINMVRAIAAPYQLDYGEGIVWQQAKMIMSGNAYGDINEVPHIVFHYPPVFHVTASLTSSMLGMDGLAAGRLVSAVSCAGASIAVGYLVWHSAPSSANQAARLISAICASLIPIAFMPIAFWSALYRVDNLAILLTMLGLCFGTKAIGNRICLVTSALFFVLALFTKQTMIAAPLACFAATYLSDRRTALAGLALGVLIGLPLFISLMAETNGGFLRHIVGYNANRIDITNLTMVWGILKYYPVLVSLPLAWLALSYGGRLLDMRASSTGAATGLQWRSGFNPRPALLSITYLSLTTLTLPAVLKSGAAFNYLTEWMYALAIGLGYQLQFAVKQALNFLQESWKSEIGTVAGKARILGFVPAAVFFMLAVQVEMASPQSQLTFDKDMERTQEYKALQRLVASTSKPVISDDMVVLVRAGKQVYLESAIIAELTSLGKFDESELLGLMANKQFAFIITNGRAEDEIFRARYTPAMRQSILDNYPNETKLAGLTIHWPQP